MKTKINIKIIKPKKLLYCYIFKMVFIKLKSFKRCHFKFACIPFN